MKRKITFLFTLLILSIGVKAQGTFDDGFFSMLVEAKQVIIGIATSAPDWAFVDPSGSTSYFSAAGGTIAIFTVVDAQTGQQLTAYVQQRLAENGYYDFYASRANMGPYQAGQLEGLQQAMAALAFGEYNGEINTARAASVGGVL
ncbi:hypothetical protein PQ465_07495 [Sphingobacterium oryzagri]|uniref:Uncharacterized protein n=1 Tax=Sphingobacterium oryzagri TaxID=3025669 RepID=A0ABY7WP67_9SPHI|nr:hypothetical protein [Sphingobacterium sp. KACC 22765]WDF70213.1 hypothetical protein PQ465_07495 [Sphingobacterium sp. KACC 22765]